MLPHTFQNDQKHVSGTIDTAELDQENGKIVIKHMGKRSDTVMQQETE